MLSPDLLKKIRDLQIRTAHLVTDALAGDYQSLFKGRGMEFEDTRIYFPGDDVRTIDWNITARTGVPHVKNFREERELTVNLLVDVSASGAFGTVGRTKNEVAAELAAILAHTAMRKNDKVGAILFTDQVEQFIPPKKGRAHIWRVIREVLTYKPKGQGTNIAVALDFLNRVVRRKTVVFLISDFLDQEFEKALLVSAKRHDLIAVTIRDPREQAMPRLSFLELEDAETGEVFLMDARDQKVCASFGRLSQNSFDQRKKQFQSMGIDRIDISTRGSTIDPIISFFRERLRRIRR